MPRTPRLILLLLAALPLLAVGCSARRPQAIVQDDRLAADAEASGDLLQAEENPPAEEPVVSAVSTVGHVDSTDSQDGTPQIEEAAATDAAVLVQDDAAVPTVVGRASDGLTLAALESLALQNNPSIQQASAAAARASGFRTQVGLKPNPSVGYFGEEIGNEGSGGLQGAFVSQMFIRGDKLEWNREVLGHDVNAQTWLVAAQRLRVLTDIRVQFYAALVAQKRLRLAREFREVAEKGVRISEDRLQRGFGTRPDVLQSQIQLSEVDLLIRRAELERQAAWNELAATSGVPDLPHSELIGEFDVPEAGRDAEAVYQQIVSTSPLVASALARVDRARANLQRQQVQPVPNVTARLGAGYDDSTGDEFANVQLSLPLPVHNRNQGNVSAACAEYSVATQNVQRLKLQIRRDLARVMREYQVAEATVGQYESSIVPRAEESLRLIEDAQEAGQFDFLRVLTARRAFFDVNLEYVTARGELSQANARLEGLLLTGGLENVSSTIPVNVDDFLRGQALNVQ